jgi:hypothetical protein
MPGVAKGTASDVVTAEGFEGRYGEAEDYTIGFETYSADADLAPLFKGLPDDRCQSPHWGYVMRGKVAYHYADRDEVYDAGEAYFAPPGHTPEIFAGTELVEFSPTEAMNKTLEVVMKNMEGGGR